MYKFTSILLVAFLISNCGASKKVTTNSKSQEVIRTDFTNYLDAIINREFSKAMDYVLPEFFEIFPKDQMIKAMEQTFETPGMTIELSDPKILNIGETSSIENSYYSKLKYSNTMRIKIESEDEETAEEKEMSSNIMLLAFEQQFGKGNVTYVAETEFYEVYSEKEVIAISADGLADWKFLVIEERQKFILEKLVPKELLK